MREVEGLSGEQLAGQLLVVGIPGPELPVEIRDQLRNRALGGIILFARNLPDLKGAQRLCSEIAEACPTPWPPFVGIDQEGGRVARLRQGVTPVPPMRVLGQLDDPALSRLVAQQQALELGALGFNINFAPVADVDSNPENPIIGDRSFGSDPALVTRHCLQFVEGFQANGLMACIKHFPGHGDTDVDSHLDLPSVRRSVVELRQTELYTFERLARHSATAMTAHVVFSALDSVPATLSPRLCTTLLRGEFGFDGVLFSDDLEMGALRRHWPIEQSAPTAVSAGCDALLICSDASQIRLAHQALTARIEADDAFRFRCREAVETSLKMRRRFPPRIAVDGVQAVERLITAPGARRLHGLLERAQPKV